jgi:2Fe-2S ferredoxin
MLEEKKEITITVMNACDEYVIKTYQHQYRNLMVLLNNSIYLENFGECGGQGRCATCMVKVVGLKGTAAAMERNEAATINKTGLEETGLRLSCQVLVTEDLQDVEIEIAGDGY